MERLSHVQVSYSQRENRELVGVDGCELIHSQFELQSDYGMGVALDYMAEVSEQLLAPGEQSELFFRLLAATLDYLRAEREQALWPAVTYFTLWAVRLSGFLPALRVSSDSMSIAEEMLRRPVAQLTPQAWTKQTAADLRRFLVREIENHIERRLVTVPILETV